MKNFKYFFGEEMIFFRLYGLETIVMHKVPLSGQVLQLK